MIDSQPSVSLANEIMDVGSSESERVYDVWVTGPMLCGCVCVSFMIRANEKYPAYSAY